MKLAEIKSQFSIRPRRVYYGACSDSTDIPPATSYIPVHVAVKQARKMARQTLPAGGGRRIVVRDADTGEVLVRLSV